MQQLIRFLSVLALASAAPAMADVLIYQFRSSSKNIGEGVEFSSSTRGYIVWNLEANHLTWITYSSRGADKYYSVNDGDPLVVSVAGASGHQFTTFSGASGTEGRYFLDFNRGLNQALKHRTGQTTFFPRTFKGQSHSIVTSVGPRLSEYTKTVVYSPKRTIAANDAGQTDDAILSGLRAELEAQGYADVSALSALTPGSTATLSDVARFQSLVPPAGTSLVSPAGARK